MKNPFAEMKFVEIPGGRYELGWRYTEQLPPSIEDDLDGWVGLDVLLEMFSQHRSVDLTPFSISAMPVSFTEHVADPYDMGDSATILDVCRLVDEWLGQLGYRLPTEDELEAACGGSLFPWGTEWPLGVPYGSETDFTKHKERTRTGLNLTGDTYKVEIVRTAFKLGDGGGAVCGGYPWPVPWFSLSPSHRLVDKDLDECLPEFLETAWFRAVVV